MLHGFAVLFLPQQSVSCLHGKDLKITKRGDKVVVGYNYQREIHVAGPAYLTLKYSGETK